MKFSLQNLKVVYQEQIWLEFSQTDIKKLEVEGSYSNKTALLNAYLNRLCLNAFVDWMRQNLELKDSVSVWPSEADLPSMWEVVNGSAISLGKTRLVLIPSDALDTEEFSVPQEWVDIHSWSADYYLAVQVDLDQCWMHVWGYATHRTLKEKGSYDPIYRTYSLERDYVITDLDVLWVAREICANEKAEINRLPSLSHSTAESLLVQLSQSSLYSPRLDVEFEQWGALLQQDNWRKHLYAQRLQNSQSSVRRFDNLVNLSQWVETRSQTDRLQLIEKSIVNVGLWLRDEMDEFTQALSWVLLPALGPEYVPLRSPTQELEAIVTQIQRTGTLIPSEARGAYFDFHLAENRLRLYAVTWSCLREWTLLLVLGAQPGYSLSHGTSMLVSDDTGVLVERVLDGDTNNTYIYACVEGSWEETFSVAIALANGASLNLPAFGFAPEED
ncbi:MAG TPA: DUF1822 family protein [Candidatus Obscuribacterales bacterium]